MSTRRLVKAARSLSPGACAETRAMQMARLWITLLWVIGGGGVF